MGDLAAKQTKCSSITGPFHCVLQALYWQCAQAAGKRGEWDELHEI